MGEPRTTGNTVLPAGTRVRETRKESLRAEGVLTGNTRTTRSGWIRHEIILDTGEHRWITWAEEVQA